MPLPTDDEMEYFNPRTEITRLFGEVSEAAADDKFMRSFMSSFAQMQRPGGPPPDTGPAAAANAYACPLLFEAIMIHFDGIPTENAIPGSAKKLRFRNKLKIPFGAVKKIAENQSFMAKFSMYTYSGQKPAMLEASSKKCNCCGKFADGFVTVTSMRMANGAEELFATGPVVSLDPVFPACQKTACNRKLKEFAERCNLESSAKAAVAPNRTALMCANDSCRKVDAKATKLKECARCQMRHYCSRDCQKADWKNHKKMCVPAKK